MGHHTNKMTKDKVTRSVIKNILVVDITVKSKGPWVCLVGSLEISDLGMLRPAVRLRGLGSLDLKKKLCFKCWFRLAGCKQTVFRVQTHEAWE